MIATLVDIKKAAAPKVAHSHFDEKHVLHDLRHYLPTQMPLKDFIHHNSLHAFQHMKFYDGIFKASDAFGYQVTIPLDEYRELYNINRIREDVLEKIIAGRKGAGNVELWKKKVLTEQYDDCTSPRIGRLRSEWKKLYEIDLDGLVHPMLFRILCSYIDQGIATWQFPHGGTGLLSALRELEQSSFTSFFKTKRAKQMLLSGKCNLRDLLKIVVGNEAFFEQYIFDQQFSHRGWSGMVATIEHQPETLYDKRIISLRDLITFELLLEIDALDAAFGTNWLPLANVTNTSPVSLFEDTTSTELREVLMIWQDAFEWSYYDEVFAAIATDKKQTPSGSGKSFQALFCIDERECSLRRYVEQVDAECETFGTPGFFGVEFYYQPENGKFYDKVCPAPVTPEYLIKEFEVKEKREHEAFYTKETNTFFTGTLLSFVFGIWAALRLALNIFRPKMSPAISNAFTHMQKHSKLTIENEGPGHSEHGLQVGFKIEEMAARVEGVLRSIGLIKDFAPIVYAIAHGSSSANNPHHGAHDCGACFGKPGSVNARVFAFMANHPKVRTILRERNIDIPAETLFIGGMHDTAADHIEFYDDEATGVKHADYHKSNRIMFERALDLNAKERSRRFASINTKGSLSQVRKAIKDRSVSFFEPRPELGHGTNSLCIVGRRSLTSGLFLDRRAFLNSYDYRTDPEGTLLAGIMRPLGPVCGGINLEYYFSRVDNVKLGAGTKLPHNVMGLVGVANGCDGDLLPGLPLQMIEVHDPVRLMLIVEQFPDVVLKTIQSDSAMYEWYIKEWVHLSVIHPETHKFHYFKNGEFVEYTPLSKKVGEISDVTAVIESANAMKTNRTADATRENLPVFTLAKNNKN